MQLTNGLKVNNLRTLKESIHYEQTIRFFIW